jgi:NADPH:quinone reductase-like Zn-dependent oxidoreductase
MDPAILSATAALVGSLVGGVSTFAAYWLTQRVQIRAQGLMKRHAERETLYAVREFVVGDRVVGSFFESWIDGEPSDAKMRAALGGAVDGVLAVYRLFPAQALVKTPEHLSDIEAAALPCAGLTAWSAVVKLGDVKPGQTVLTQGTGGVSLFALQFAKMCGARVIATSSSDAKIERLKLLGADFTLNYKSTPDWGKKARKLSGHGVDLVVEVGGIGTLNESIRATKIGGTIAFIGVLAGSPPAQSRILLIVMQQQRLQGVTVGSVEDLQAMVDAPLATLNFLSLS